MLLYKQVILNVSVPWKFQLTYSKNLKVFTYQKKIWKVFLYCLWYPVGGLIDGIEFHMY
jgi:hypothetical protein